MPSIDLRKYEKKKAAAPLKVADRPGIMDLLNRDISFGSPELADKKKESLYLELGSLLHAGISLKSALELVSGDQKGEKDRALFKNIQTAVLSGTAFSGALKKSGRFSLYEIYSLQIGEETGKLTEVLQDLAKFYQNKIRQRRKIVSALTYPAIVVSTSLGVVFFMLKFVVPMFSDVYRRFGGELPWITQMIINVSKGVENNFFAFLITVVCIAGSIFSVRKSDRYRDLSSKIVLRLPVAGNLVRKIYLTRFSTSMRLLINAKLPLLRAIALSRQMIGYYPIESSLQQVEDAIMKGGSLHESLQQYAIFPPKMIQLLKVGEETNQLNYFFERIAEQYMDEVEYKTSTLSSVMQPMIILFLGFFVGIIMIAIYLPLFQMGSNFK
jgi:type IV pilus assembly protein PilC